MRIGIDARSLYYSAGGIGRTTRLLIEAMLSGGELHEDFVLFVSRKERSWRSMHPYPPGKVRRVSLWTPGHHRWEQWTLPIELAPHRLNLIHSPDFIPPFVRRCPAVITVHDLAFLRFPSLLTTESQRYYGQVHRAVRSADAIVAVSDATKQDLIDLLGVPADRITVVHWGMESRFRPLPPEDVSFYRLKRGLPERFVLWLGVIEPRKNLGTVLRALALLRDNGWDPPMLVIAGPAGWLADETLGLVESLHLEEKVLLLGSPNLDEQPLLYNAAQLFVFPSLYEGFGLPPLEAMACGTPVIAATTPALNEVLGKSALFAHPKDVEGWAGAIYRLLEDVPLRMRLGEDGRTRASRFRWEDAADAYLNVYRRVAA